MCTRKYITSFSAKACSFMLLSLLLSGTPNSAQDRGQSVKSSAETKPEQRIALVIGNADYKEAKLTNPANDARDMAAALRAVGFEVLPGEDRNSRQMKELIRQFGQKLRAGGVGVFYFAGHGVQVAGKNYLIPVGAEINSEAEVEYESVELGFVLAQLEEARNRLNVVILDACRNNPYARSFRSGSRGLAGVRNAPSGTLIAYATAADDVASDGGARNGLFTGELLTQIKTPGLTLERIFRQTRTNVRSKSSGKQVPYEYSSVEGEDFYFLPPNAPPPVVSAEQQAWERAKQKRTLEAVRGFLSLYPNSLHDKEARSLLAILEREESLSQKAAGIYNVIVVNAELGMINFVLVLRKDGSQWTAEVKDSPISQTVISVNIEGDKIAVVTNAAGIPAHFNGQIIGSKIAGDWESGGAKGVWKAEKAFATTQSHVKTAENGVAAGIEGIYDFKVVADGQGDFVITLIIKRVGGKLITSVENGGDLNVTGIELKEPNTVNLSLTYQGNGPIPMSGKRVGDNLIGKWEFSGFTGSWEANKKK